MKVNDKFISKLINVLEHASELPTHNVRKMGDTGQHEHIVRYEDGNNIAISIYFAGDCYCSIGFIDHDGRYRNYLSWARIDRLTSGLFFFDLALSLHRCSDCAIDSYENATSTRTND